MAVDTYALTSLTVLKSRLGITASTWDTMLEDMIDASSAMVEKYLGRKVLARDYREWKDGTRQKTLVMDQYPINKVARMAYGAANALAIIGDEPTDIRATVEAQSDELRLLRIDSTGTSVEATPDYAAGGETTTLLAATINGLTGWTATVQASIYSYDLHRTGGRDALGKTVYLTYPDCSDIEYRVRDEAGMIEIVGAGGWHWPDEAGSGRFPLGFQSILVEYNAGYTSIPYDIEQVVIELASAMYLSRSREAGIKSETEGDYSYTMQDANAGGVVLTDAMKSALSSWRRIR